MKTLIAIVNAEGRRVQDLLIPENSDVIATVDGYPGGATLQIGPYDEKAPPPPSGYASWVGLSLEITVNDSPNCPMMRFDRNLFEILGEVQSIKLVFSPAVQKNAGQ